MENTGKITPPPCEKYPLYSILAVGVMTLSLMQSTRTVVSVNLNLTCYHISESVSNFTMVSMPVCYCAS